ncbi:hypothetical protein [Microbacterium elymi]|uniref:Uncharacterized protein n=1 Tax=Microbacterium elymi TaxID=2909587 RepID=A0ABY5NKK8_9MICO|nr:hypothetical protein [Microbacterium elymi]UUT35700.1 hypothetical protein L2X98_20930 [Microbacterium elymi]
MVLTIAAERVELARITMGPHAGTRLLVHAWTVVAALVIGVVSPTLGAIAMGLALLGLVLWLVVHDVARRTIRAGGGARYMAACILAGYFWLAVAGVALLFGEPTSQPVYDAVVHAVFLGYTISMIMAHATTILPGVLHIALPYRPAFWVPVVLVQAEPGGPPLARRRARPAARLADRRRAGGGRAAPVRDDRGDQRRPGPDEERREEPAEEEDDGCRDRDVRDVRTPRDDGAAPHPRCRTGLARRRRMSAPTPPTPAPAPRPQDEKAPNRGFWVLRDIPTLMWLIFVVIAVIAHRWLPVATWLMLHLLLLGAVTHAILVWSQYFSYALALRTHPGRSPPPVGAAAAGQRGALLVVAGMMSALWPLTLVGAASLIVAVIWHGASLYARSRAACRAGSDTPSATTSPRRRSCRSGRGWAPGSRTTTPQAPWCWPTRC